MVMRLILLCALACASCSTPPATAATWDSSRVVDDRTVEINYTRSSGDGCGEAEGAEVSYSEDRVTVRLLIDESTYECPANALSDSYIVRLKQSLDGRTVVDAERR